MSASTIDVEKLTPADRLLLMERLWNSLSDDNLQPTNAQELELDRRLDELDDVGPHGIPWEEVLCRIEGL